MREEKLPDAYGYLSEHNIPGFHKRAWMFLCLADIDHLKKWGRTVSGCDLPVQDDLKNLKIPMEDESKNYRYGNLSVSDEEAIDEIVKKYGDCSDEELLAAIGGPINTVEDVFRGEEDQERVESMIELINEGIAMDKAMEGFRV